MGLSRNLNRLLLAAAIGLVGWCGLSALDGARADDKVSAGGPASTAQPSSPILLFPVEDIVGRDQAPVIFCFAPGTPQEVRDYYNRITQMDMAGLRYYVGNRWSGTLGSRVELTWSFAPDGLPVNGRANVLFSRMDQLFASQGGRQTWMALFHRAFERWTQVGGITYTHVTNGIDPWDDGAPWGTPGNEPTEEDTRGDIRIAMTAVDGPGNVLAFNMPPENGDMVMDSAEDWADPFGDFQSMVSTVTHENGHGLGLMHVCPGEGTKLMEPSYSPNFDGPQHDDIRAIQRLYGDPFEDDNSIGAATEIGSLEPDQSILLGTPPPPAVCFGSVLSIDANGEQDFFRFTVTAPRQASVFLVPWGFECDSSIEFEGQCQSGNLIDSSAVANLNLQLIGRDGVTVLASSIFNPAGESEYVENVPLPAAGDYYIRVYEGNTPTGSQPYVLLVYVSDADCNNNGVRDEIDVFNETSLDCNFNNVPDECEDDCNGNGVPDDCDMCAGSILLIECGDCLPSPVDDPCCIPTSDDCNDNGIPDECDIASGTSLDCNGNGVPDNCDLTSGASGDCNNDAVPDDCQTDCNGNGIPDNCDLVSGEVEDCNANHIPDECDLNSGLSLDCNFNAVPDECEPDCNGNGVPDLCDILTGTSDDCNLNGTPDDCEPNNDCNANGVQDICDIGLGTVPDCNNNNVPDSCDLASGSSADCNANSVPDDCEPRIIYVAEAAVGLNNGTSWFNAYRSLQSALTDAAGGGCLPKEIWVVRGTYRPAAPSGSRSASFSLVNGVGVYGGFAGGEAARSQRNPAANVTILSGDLNANDSGSSNRTENSYHVVRALNVSATTVLDGFTIRAGNANGGASPDLVGAGVYISSASPKIENCTITSNTASEGAGVYLLGATSLPAIKNCTISNNAASMDGGGLYNDGAAPTLTGCTIRSNSGNTGGGVFVYSGNLTLSQCLLNVNTAATFGGGMYNGNGTSPTATETIFSFNSAVEGGGMGNVSASPKVKNCTFSGNAADAGGGMSSSGGAPMIVGTSFIANTALFGGVNRGGGVRNSSCNANFVNCYFAGNQAGLGGGMDNSSSNSRMTNCVFSGNVANDGGAMYNITSSPILTNCSLARNAAIGMFIPVGGGILNFSGSSPIITNCILWGNTAGGIADSPFAQIYTDGGGSPVVTYTCVQAGYPGTGNIFADPKFILDLGVDGAPGTADDNLRLMNNSPCIDQGTHPGVPVDVADLDGDNNTTEQTPLDFDGKPRFVDHPEIGDLTNGNPPAPDMGAFEVSVDCNHNGRADNLDIAAGGSMDCNANAVPDECDITGGISNDCNGDNVPDECDPDCNTNGVADGCDITGGVSQDCNADGIPDECNIAGGSAQDCNVNGIPDACDIAAGTALDCNTNNVPDSCDLASGTSQDCNANGSPDSCDIAAGTALDCNTNGVPDSCDLGAGTSLDCNLNGVPDSCDLATGVSGDCNTNSIPDDCEIASGASQDCNLNLVPDACDIADGFSGDCNANSQPDECDIDFGLSADCNSNAAPDECDIASGASPDINGDGVPDECECAPPALVWVHSVATHRTGPKSTVDLFVDFNLTTDSPLRTSEPRDAGIRLIEIQFDRDIQNGTWTITGPGGVVGGGPLARRIGVNGPFSLGAIDMNQPLPNDAVYTISITAAAGLGCDINTAICVAALAGDFNNNGAVTITDKAELLGFVFQPVSQATARYDLQTGGGGSGVIDVSDVAAWSGFFGTTVVGDPCP